MCVFAACTGSGGESAVVPSTATPSITDASATCDADDAKWTFEVTTDAWTGNGQVILSADGDYVEKHGMYSREADAEGTSDELKLDLTVVADWRDVTLGSSTAFNCHTRDLAGVLVVWTRTGGDRADCRAFGESPERWEEWDGSTACDTVLSDDRPAR